MNLILLLLFSSLFIFPRVVSLSSFVYKSGSSSFIQLPIHVLVFFTSFLGSPTLVALSLKAPRLHVSGEQRNMFFAPTSSIHSQPPESRTHRHDPMLCGRDWLVRSKKNKPHCYFACRNDNTLFWISPQLSCEWRKGNKYYPKGDQKKTVYILWRDLCENFKTNLLRDFSVSLRESWVKPEGNYINWRKEKKRKKIKKPHVWWITRFFGEN